MSSVSVATILPSLLFVFQKKTSQDGRLFLPTGTDREMNKNRRWLLINSGQNDAGSQSLVWLSTRSLAWGFPPVGTTD